MHLEVALVPTGRRVSESLPGLPAELDGGSVRVDELDRIADAREKGYTLVSDRDSLAQGSREANKLLGLFRLQIGRRR